MKSVYLVCLTIVAGICCLLYDVNNLQTKKFQQWVIIPVRAQEGVSVLNNIRSYTNAFCDKPKITISEGLIIASTMGCEIEIPTFQSSPAVAAYNEEELIVPKKGRRYTYLFTSIFFVFAGVWFTYMIVSKQIK